MDRRAEEGNGASACHCEELDGQKSAACRGRVVEERRVQAGWDKVGGESRGFFIWDCTFYFGDYHLENAIYGAGEANGRCCAEDDEFSG